MYLKRFGDTVGVLYNLNKLRWFKMSIYIYIYIYINIYTCASVCMLTCFGNRTNLETEVFKYSFSRAEENCHVSSADFICRLYLQESYKNDSDKKKTENFYSPFFYSKLYIYIYIYIYIVWECWIQSMVESCQKLKKRNDTWCLLDWHSAFKNVT